MEGQGEERGVVGIFAFFSDEGWKGGQERRTLTWRTLFSEEKNKERCQVRILSFVSNSDPKNPSQVYPSFSPTSRPEEPRGERGRGLLPTPTKK